MKIKKSSGWLIGAVYLSIAFVFEALGAARYISRLPEDWVGVGLYVSASVLLAVAAFGFYIKWTRERGKENQEG